MSSIRIRTANASKFVSALVAAGFEARFLGAGSASTRLNGGCCDSGHCPQHEGATNSPLEWGTLETNASGQQAHRVFQSC